MSLDKPVLRSHKPSGTVSAPFVLLEGEEKAGKTWAAVLLTKSERVGRTFFLDLGEGTAEEYGAIPGTSFEVLEHDGTYASVLEQVLAVKELARTAQAAGEPVVCLIVDSLSDEWDGLRNWVNERAREKPKNKAKLREDPAAELDIPRNLWNDVDRRHNKLMTALLTFPGIVLGTARGKSISATDPDTGQPYRDGRRDYRVEGHKQLAFQATLWLRMTRGQRPQVIGARSVHAGVRPNIDKPQEIIGHDENMLEWLIFDVLKYEPGAGGNRVVTNLRGGELTEDERLDDGQPPAPQPAPQQRPANGQRKPTPDEMREQLKARASQPKPTAEPAAPVEQAAVDDTPAPAETLDEKLHRVREYREHVKRARGGPALNVAKANAWQTLADLVPGWTADERLAHTQDCLARIDPARPHLNTADATVDDFDTLTKLWEDEQDESIRREYVAANA